MEVVRSALSGVTGVTEVRVPGQDPGHESVLIQAQLVQYRGSAPAEDAIAALHKKTALKARLVPTVAK